jgi:hypothetical protein
MTGSWPTLPSNCTQFKDLSRTKLLAISDSCLINWWSTCNTSLRNMASIFFSYNLIFRIFLRTHTGPGCTPTIRLVHFLLPSLNFSIKLFLLCSSTTGHKSWFVSRLRPSLFLVSLVFLVVPGFKLRASHLLSRRCITIVTLPTVFLCGVSSRQGLVKLFTPAGLEPWSSWFRITGLNHQHPAFFVCFCLQY